MPKKKTETEYEQMPRPRGRGLGWFFGVFLIAIGLLWLLARYDLIRMDCSVVCPTLLIILGILFIFKSVGRGGGCC
ncbi:MAG: DUF5668 domain-containing protein [Candidatus Micrarchaeota archaeon]